MWTKKTITAVVESQSRDPRYNLVNLMQVLGTRKRVTSVTVERLSGGEREEPLSQ
jgi:hypothetical protein